MLSKKTEASLAIAVNLMYISGSGPMKWDQRHKCVKFIRNIWHFGFCILNFLVMFGYEAFVIFRTAQALLPDDGEEIDLGLTCHLLYTVSCYAIPVHLQLNTFVKWKEIPAFINAYIQFFNYFKRHYVVQQESKIRNGCEKLIRIFFSLAALIMLQNCILIIKKPSRPFFLTSLMENPKKGSKVLRLFLTIIHLHIWLSFWAQLLFYGTLLYTYAFPALGVIRQMSANQDLASMHRITSDKLRTSIIFMRMYRSVQILHCIFNFICKEIFFPGHKVVMSSAVIFSIYGAIKLHSSRAILMAFVAVTGLAYLGILFRRMGKFFDCSKMLLNSWQGNNNKILNKYLNSCKPLNVEIGSYYFVRKSTVVALIGFIVNSAINMLLTF